MKKYIPILLASLISSALSFGLFYHWAGQQEIKREAQQYSKLVNDKELVLSGDLERFFTASQPNNFISAANSSKSAVVAVRAIQMNEGSRSRKNNISKSNGSGVIISKDGYIVTNLHVVEDATDIEITLEDRREFTASLVGTDAGTDLALLKINSSKLPFLIIGNSDSLHIGEWVLAIGNPFKLQSSVTAGIVSAKARNINILERQGVESFIQTDAAINSGNSGGALINTNGELVGINTAIMTDSGKYEGFSFAVPSNLVRKVVYDLRTYGAVQRGWMGVNIFNVDAEKAKELNLGFVGGVFIDLVDKDGAANIAGMQKGDVITKINKVKTSSVPMFMEQVANYRPGDELNVEYFRNGVKNNTSVVLRNQLNSTDYVAVRKDPVLKELGFELRDLDRLERSKLNAQGVYVVSVMRNSIIDRTNMDPGYVITAVNKQKIKSVNQLIDILKRDKGMTLLEGFYERYPGEFPYSFENN